MSENHIRCFYVKFPSAGPLGSSIKPTKAGKIERCWCWRAGKRAECAGVALCQKYRKMREAEACDWDEILFPTITHSHILKVKHTHTHALLFHILTYTHTRIPPFFTVKYDPSTVVSFKKLNYPPNIWKHARIYCEVMDYISINLHNFMM